MRTRLKGTRSCTVVLKGLLFTHKPGLFYYAETCEHFCFSPTVQKPQFQRLVGSKQTFAGALSAPQPLVCTMRRGVTGVGIGKPFRKGPKRQKRPASGRG